MNFKKNILIYPVLLILLVNFSLAADILSTVLNPFGTINLGSIYLRNYAFIDAVVYFILFLSLAQLELKKIYPQNIKEAKLVAVAVGLALTISMAVVELNTGLNLGRLGPIALIILVTVMAMLLFNLFKGLFEGENSTGISAALTYLIVYGLLVLPFGALTDWINRAAPMLGAILALAPVASFVYLIILMFNMLGIKGGKSQANTPPPDPSGSGTPPPGPTPSESYPDDLVALIGSLIPAINDLENKRMAYCHQFHDIILLRHHYMKGSHGARMPNVSEMSTLLTFRNELLLAGQKVNNIINTINSHPGYMLLNFADLSKLHNILGLHKKISKLIIDFEVDARLAYNNYSVPPRIVQI